MNIWQAAFWKATAERAIKSFAQGAIVAIGGNAVSAWDLDYVGISGTGLSMALLSVLTSVASDITTGDGPSLTNAEVIPESYFS